MLVFKSRTKKFVKRAARTVCALLLAGAVAWVSVPYQAGTPVSAASTLSELQDRQQELESQKAENDEKLDALKEDTEKQAEYKETLNAQIETVQQEIDSYNLEINALNDQITEKEAEIADKQASIDANYEKLKERLCALYKAGEASTLEIILNAENVSDLLRKTQIMQAVTEHDTELMNTLKTEMEEVAGQKAEIESNKAELTDSRTKLQDSQNQLTALMEEADSLLTDLERQQKELEEENASLSEEMQQAQADLDQWYADYYASQSSGDDSNGSGGSSDGGSSSGGNTGSNEPVDGTGQFMWPVPGYYGAITQGFHSGHKGLDISGGGIYGQPIVASDSGYVVFAGFGSAANSHNRYGYCVDLDHGNGYSTMYAHCSALTVSTGSYVTKGQVIGYVGNTGQSYGAHLHFEIRHYGTPVNPSSYV